MRYATIQNGTVGNIVEWDGNEGEPAEGQENWLPFSQLAWPDQHLVVIPAGKIVSVGDTYDGTSFQAAVPEQPAHPLPRVVPAVITNAQARLALLNADKLKFVQDALNGLPVEIRERAEIEWNHRPTIERESDIVAIMAQALNLSSAELDNLFTQAVTL